MSLGMTKRIQTFEYCLWRFFLCLQIQGFARFQWRYEEFQKLLGQNFFRCLQIQKFASFQWRYEEFQKLIGLKIFQWRYGVFQKSQC